MRLLSKTQIQEHKVKESKLEIDQGVKMARAIDVLRETKDQEEVSLEKFRRETVKSIKAEIDALVLKKDSLESEIGVLGAERTRLLVPLDAEWEKVNEKSKELSSIEKRLTLLSSNLASKELDTERIIKEWESYLEQAKAKLEQANLNYADSDRVKKDSERILLSSERELENSKSLARVKVQELYSREMSILARESSIEVKTKNADERELLLNAKETFINDKYLTLERTTNRLK